MTCPACSTITTSSSATFCARCGWQFRAIGGPVAYASFGRRAAALGIDFALLFIIAFPIALTLLPPEPWERVLLAAGPAAMEADPRIRLLLFYRECLLLSLIYLFYAIEQIALIRTSLGGTIGKYWLGLQIVGPTGEPPTRGQIAKRQLAWIASIVPLYLGFFWPLLDRQRRTFHDLLAGTTVVRRAPASARSQTPPLLPTAWPTAPSGEK